MWRNVKHNRFMIISGLETLVLGAYLIYVQNVFIPKRPHHPMGMDHLVIHAQDPWIAILLISIGTLAVITGLWNTNRFKAKRLSLVTMVAIWATYFVAFIYHDLSRPGPIGLGTLLIAFILIRLFAEALWGDKT